MWTAFFIRFPKKLDSNLHIPHQHPISRPNRKLTRYDCEARQEICDKEIQEALAERPSCRIAHQGASLGLPGFGAGI
jgi:hypothetical protein